MRRSTIVVISLLSSLVALGSLSATTFVAIEDATLLAQAELVVVAKVGAQLPPVYEGRPVTDYLFEIERVLKGEVSASAIVVRVPGGERADGVGLKIWGAPTFRAGETTLLFLGLAEDGTYRVLHLMLGAFHRVDHEQVALAMRDFDDTVELAGAAPRARRDLRRAREFDRFADWLADRATAVVRRADYFVRTSPAELSSINAEFTLFDQDGLALRWFEFDSGGSVGYRAYESGQPGLSGGGFAEFQRALAAWTNESHTPIRLNYLGTTTLRGGLKTFDSVNAILFGDPNEEVEGTFTCGGGGGTLAYGGPWYSTSATGTFRGTTYLRIQGADLVTNDGIDCFFARSANPSAAAEELFGHELGHNLGLGHSSEARPESNAVLRDALMYYLMHDDGRGARFNSDDEAGIRTLYDPSYSTGGGNPTCPNADTTLCFHSGRFRATLTWRNQYNNATGVGYAVPSSDLSGFFHFGDPSNVEIILKVLDFGGTIKVFYGQLTDFRFQLTITDTLTGRTKVYANTPTNCGEIDNNFNALSAGAIGEEATLAAEAGTCVPGPNTLCLLGGRFRLEVDWRNQYNNTSGRGLPVNLSDLTGAFGFTDTANVELLVKTLDFGDKRLVLWGALSDLEYTMRVTDTVLGKTKTFSNPAGKYCGGLDANF